jgi:3-oxoacyl-[acyl-carrier protein] reductase
MDLGISGRNALVCAGSKGLGRACAYALVREGVNVVIVARNPEALEKTSHELKQLKAGSVTFVVADITTPHGRTAALNACPKPDILINNAGGPPAGDFREFTEEIWLAAVNANMLTPIELIKATLDGMMERGFGRIINITSSAVKAPIDILALSNGARTGLTGFVAGLSRKTIAKNVTINNLLPGTFDTETMRARSASMAQANGKTFEEIQTSRLQPIPAGRFGNPDEFGDACAYLCSKQAGYITGMNFLIDGGAYPGTF